LAYSKRGVAPCPVDKALSKIKDAIWMHLEAARLTAVLTHDTVASWLSRPRFDATTRSRSGPKGGRLHGVGFRPCRDALLTSERRMMPREMATSTATSPVCAKRTDPPPSLPRFHRTLQNKVPPKYRQKLKSGVLRRAITRPDDVPLQPHDRL
jgi:hypothetical protein